MRLSSRKSIAIFLGFGAIVHVLVLAIHLRTRCWDMDFSDYYCWASALRIGLDPYTVEMALLRESWGFRQVRLSRITQPPSCCASSC